MQIAHLNHSILTLNFKVCHLDIFLQINLTRQLNRFNKIQPDCYPKQDTTLQVDKEAIGLLRAQTLYIKSARHPYAIFVYFVL